MQIESCELRLFSTTGTRFQNIQENLKQLAQRPISSVADFEKIIFTWVSKYHQKPFVHLTKYLTAIKDGENLFFQKIIPLAAVTILNQTKTTFAAINLLDSAATNIVVKLSRKDILCIFSHLIFGTLEQQEAAFEYPDFSILNLYQKSCAIQKKKLENWERNNW